MASTRDKRMKTDSPTPAHSTESSTPTTKSSSAIKLKRMSRSRSGMLSSGKMENEEENDSVGLSEDTVSSTASNDVVAKAANTRAKRQLAKEDKEESNGDAKGEDDNKETKGIESPGKRVTKSQVLKSKATSLTSAMARRSAMLKRTSLPLPVKASLRNFSRRSSGAKLNDSGKVKEETAVTPKKGKGTKKPVEKKEPEDEEEPMETEHEEKIELSQDIDLNLEIKQEKIDPKSNDFQNIRRSTRQRKSTIKDRDSPFTRRSQARDKSESKRDSLSPALSSASIKTEKDSAKAISISVETTETCVEKDQSLSPELVSEELDTESVQHLYDKPDFLENNLGIEKDPKLGEIVKVQEKTKTIVETALITVVMKKDVDDSVEKDNEDEKEEDIKTENVDVNTEEKIEENVELIKEDVEVNKIDQENVQQEKDEVLEEKVENEDEIQEEVGDTETKMVEKSEENSDKNEEVPDEKIETEVEETKKEEEIKKVEVNMDVNVDTQEEKSKEKQNIEQVNGENMEIDEPNETKQTEKAESIEENKDENIENESRKEEIKEENVNDIKEEKPEKIDESEENKENNVESSAKSIGSNSPRSEDCLKIMSEANTPKIELNETAELLKIKENHFKSLGLFTHKAAEEAKIAKQKRREELALQAAQQSNRKSKKDSSDYHSGSGKTSGTLKTIIKLPRTDKEKRKTRMPLKITFQKKNRDRDANGSSNSAENSFYTIQNEKDSSSTESHGAISRKSHNRSYNHVIPEKASSFKVHPERICKDQCFYCGGKFGLYDTPCHIAQIKSTERQNKILENEEKLTKDSCLCDACFRHVDRRANCPSYRNKQRPSASSQPSTSTSTSPVYQNQNNQNNFERTFGICNVIDCNENAVHSIRKKWFIKMKKTISKIFQINLDLQPTNTNVSICEEHFAALSHIMVCAMCKRKLPRNHIFYINQDIARLEHIIAEQGLHVKLSNSTLVVCKLCSYYNNLLFKPPEPKTQKADFVRNYTKKLMKHNSVENEYANRHIVSVDDDDVQEVPIRNDDLTLTIKNGKIQPKKLPDRFQNNKEVTITMKGSPAPSGHMLLDNDVMVGYDVPMLENCPSPPAHTIRNPNYKGPISTQTTTTAQKTSSKNDDQHKKKKEMNDNNEMARVLKSNPNISMRELFPGEEEMALQINLPFNSSHAQRTPEGWFKVQMTIQYDDVTKALWENLQRPYGNQSSFIRHLVLLEKYYRNGDLVLSQSASNSAVTYSESVRNRLRSYDNIPSSLSTAGTANLSNEVSIIPASKAKKSNDSLSITAQPGNSLLKRKSSQNEMGSPKQKLVKIDETLPKKASPPELISFTQKPATRSSAKDKEPTTISNNTSSTTTLTSTTSTTNSTSLTSQTGSNNGNGNSNNVVVLPDTLTPHERKQCSKSWRPTLIPITGSGQLLNSNGPLYQTADGRKLPELVQVMSGGKPYHISIHDYNKMCIIRREKLQQQLTQKARQQTLVQNQNTAGGNSPNSVNASTNSNNNSTTTNSIPASTTALSIIPMPKEKEPTSNNFKPSTTSTPSNATSKLANIPNQILEQNSLIPLNASEQNGKKHHNGGLPPPLTQTYTKSNTNNMMSMLPPALSALSKTVNALQPTSSAAAQLAAWNSLWNDNEININSDNMAALAQIANLANLGTNLMEPSAATLLSKIPKSLTVIPQTKTDRRSSDEQKNNSAST
ncbi:serine-rich adhesin for platelets isoform X3 [Chironomus tepperi]|uniref:serine-rich adhesin for platelets isoform X3 n=1 Tax=Chironomus tepperi TaxID=113505 RepID=UPI00391F8452